MISRISKFVEAYRRKTHTNPPEDKEVEAYVIEGLAHNKETLGKPLCPCRFYPEGKEEAVKEGSYVCPCIDMRTSKQCH